MSRWCEGLHISGGFALLAAWFALVNGWQLLAVILSAALLHELGHLLVLYLLLTRKCRKQEAKQECFHTCWYGYDLQQDVSAAMQYAAYLSRYAGRWNEEGEKSEDASERRDDQK